MRKTGAGLNKLTMERHVSDLEKDFEFQKIEWPLYRIGWVLMGVFLTLGAVGLFGHGIFSRKHVKQANFSIEYDRYLRYSVSTELVVNAGSLGKDSSLTINSDYLKKVKIDKILPEPKLMELSGKHIKLKFSDSKINEITFYLDPIDYGAQSLEIEINGNKKTVDQYIFF